MITTPSFVLALSKSSDNSNSSKDWNFYRANSHNLTILNDIGTLKKDCNITGQIGPCWEFRYQTFVP